MTENRAQFRIAPRLLAERASACCSEAKRARETIIPTPWSVAASPPLHRKRIAHNEAELVESAHEDAAQEGVHPD